MTDLLTEQAEIKARFHPPQPRVSGKFIQAATAEQLQALRDARKQHLRAELIAKGLLADAPPPGCVKVAPHIRHVGEPPVSEADLFDQIAA